MTAFLQNCRIFSPCLLRPFSGTVSEKADRAEARRKMGSVPLRDPVRLREKGRRKLFLPSEISSHPHPPARPSFVKQSEARKMAAQFRGGSKEDFESSSSSSSSIELRTLDPHTRSGHVSGWSGSPDPQSHDTRDRQLFCEWQDFVDIRLSRSIVVVSSLPHLDLLLLSGVNRSFRFRPLSPPARLPHTVARRPSSVPCVAQASTHGSGVAAERYRMPVLVKVYEVEILRHKKSTTIYFFLRDIKTSSSSV